MVTETILAKVQLPCSAKQLESLVLKASHSGNWIDGKVRESDGFLELYVVTSS